MGRYGFFKLGRDTDNRQPIYGKLMRGGTIADTVIKENPDKGLCFPCPDSLY